MKRKYSQKTGELGESLVMTIIDKQGDWIVRKIDKDYGLDLEIQLVNDEIVSGKIIKIQVKGSQHFKVNNEKINFNISTDFLKNCLEFRVPVLLVLIDTTNEVCYYEWVQKYLKINKVNLETRKSHTIKISSQNDLKFGLSNEIKEIAKGLNSIQLQLDLNASLESAFLLGDFDTYSTLAQISMGISNTYALEIDKVIENLIKLGNTARGTFEGNKNGQLLMLICRKYGNKFTSEHIGQMIIRNSSYSRTGINALGVLYNSFPNHIKSLNLPEYFKNNCNVKIRYYCLLNENYLDIKSISLCSLSLSEYKIENLYIRKDDKDKIFLKSINNGDSAILDYVQEIKNRS